MVKKKYPSTNLLWLVLITTKYESPHLYLSLKSRFFLAYEQPILPRFGFTTTSPSHWLLHFSFMNECMKSDFAGLQILSSFLTSDFAWSQQKMLANAIVKYLAFTLVRLTQYANLFHCIINTFASLKGNILMHKMDLCEHGFKWQVSYWKSAFPYLEMYNFWGSSNIKFFSDFWLCMNPSKDAIVKA